MSTTTRTDDPRTAVPTTAATIPATRSTAARADAAAGGDLAHAPARPHRLARLGLFRDLEHRRDAVSKVTPNWFAAVMGTGIVAVAAASLPVQPWGLRGAATVVWALAALMLVVLVVATVAHWVLFRETARSHASDPVMSHFYGAPPMAFLTVGAGTLLLGKDVIGLRAAVDIDWTLWFIGTLAGLASAVVVPYLAFTRHQYRPDSAFGGWLMPVVPPMVSATTGAMLLAYAPAGQARLTLLVACSAMFGISLLATLVILPLIWQRLALHKVGPAATAPTVWIVLGPLGQSITAAGLLGAASATVVGTRGSHLLSLAGDVYGVAVWGFAMVWVAIALAITVRTVRQGMPFALTWWSFTFPVGTLVTGTSQLWLHTGADVFRWTSVLLYVGLVGAWAVVGVRTLRGARSGWLLAGLPAPSPASRASVAARAGAARPGTVAA